MPEHLVPGGSSLTRLDSLGRPGPLVPGGSSLPRFGFFERPGRSTGTMYDDPLYQEAQVWPDLILFVDQHQVLELLGQEDQV